MILRILAVAAFAPLAAPFAFAANPSPAEQQLKQQLANSQKEHAAAEKQIASLKEEIKQGNAKVTQLQNDLKKAKGDDTTDDKTIKGLQAQLDALRKAKFVHTIVYKAKEDTSGTEYQSLADDANVFFAAAKSVRAVWAGKAAVEAGSSTTYNAMVVLVFDDAAGLQSFQKDPQWKKFTEKHAKLWDDPKYYDSQIGK